MKTNQILKLAGAVLIGYGISTLIKKYYYNNQQDKNKQKDEEKSEARGGNFIKDQPKESGHYCLKNGGNSGYFSTDSCIDGYTEVFPD